MKFNGLNENVSIALERIEDVSEVAKRNYEARFSSFMEAETVFSLRSYIREEDGFVCGFNGGYVGAERCVFGAWPEYESPGFPIDLLKIDCPPQKTLTHRDCLGSLLGLGLKRDMIGDILCDERVFYVFVHNKITVYIQANLEKIGNVGVKVTKIDCEEFVPPIPKTQSKGIFIMSNRLDAVLAGTLDLSRSKAAELIVSERVSLNHSVKTDVSCKVNTGDLLSVRGYGRYRIGNEGSKSRKGRTYLEIIKYI